MIAVPRRQPHRRLACFLLVFSFFARPALAESFYIEGEGGVPIAVTAVGPKDAPAILFIHGITMGAESFEPQLESNLADRFRLVAFDLRGHGMSGKPWAEEAYTDTRVWAGDVRRVIAATGISRPVIVAWSYGALVASDYIRHEGTEGLAGLVLVAVTGGLVDRPPPEASPDPELLAQLNRARELRNIPAFDAQEEATEIIMPMLTHDTPDVKWARKAKILGMMVPPYAQASLRKHPMANTDLTKSMQDLPVLLVYGASDPSVSHAEADALVASMPLASAHRFENAGHSPFAEYPAIFNEMLERFVDTTKENKDDK